MDNNKLKATDADVLSYLIHQMLCDSRKKKYTLLEDIMKHDTMEIYSISKDTVVKVLNSSLSALFENNGDEKNEGYRIRFAWFFSQKERDADPNWRTRCLE